MLTRRVLWMLTMLYLAAVFILTHLPPAYLPRVSSKDTLLHFGAYFLLALLLGLAVLKAFPSAGRAELLIVLGAVAVCAAVDEVTQPLVGREAEVSDWIADVAGAASAGALLAFRLSHRRRTGRRHRGVPDVPPRPSQETA